MLRRSQARRLGAPRADDRLLPDRPSACAPTSSATLAKRRRIAAKPAATACARRNLTDATHRGAAGACAACRTSTAASARASSARSLLGSREQPRAGDWGWIARRTMGALRGVHSGSILQRRHRRDDRARLSGLLRRQVRRGAPGTAGRRRRWRGRRCCCARESRSRRAPQRGRWPRRRALTPDLFAALRALRLRIAEKRGVPAYMIFNDATLRSMCAAVAPNAGTAARDSRRRRRQIARLWRRVSARHRQGATQIKRRALLPFESSAQDVDKVNRLAER